MVQPWPCQTDSFLSFLGSFLILKKIENCAPTIRGHIQEVTVKSGKDFGGCQMIKKVAHFIIYVFYLVFDGI